MNKVLPGKDKGLEVKSLGIFGEWQIILFDWIVEMKDETILQLGLGY